jgi:hypothetical protein
MTLSRQPPQVPAEVPQQPAKARVARLAARQFGRITRAQLSRLGVGDSTIRDWTRLGYLHRRLRGVYAVGHPGRSGPRGIMIHNERNLARTDYHGIPVTTPEQTVLDLAASCADEPVLVRVALAELDFRGVFDPDALLALCRPGKSGSALLRSAIAHFDPRFAATRSRFERNWIVYCEQTDTPKPDAINVRIHGIRSDNVYYDAKLIVELDGVDNHRSPAQVRRDRRNDRIPRGHGWLVLRYSWPDVEDDPRGVRADVVAALSGRIA